MELDIIKLEKANQRRMEERIEQLETEIKIFGATNSRTRRIEHFKRRIEKSENRLKLKK